MPDFLIGASPFNAATAYQIGACGIALTFYMLEVARCDWPPPAFALRSQRWR